MRSYLNFELGGLLVSFWVYAMYQTQVWLVILGAYSLFYALSVIFTYRDNNKEIYTYYYVSYRLQNIKTNVDVLRVMLHRIAHSNSVRPTLDLLKIQEKIVTRYCKRTDENWQDVSIIILNVIETTEHYYNSIP